MANNPFDGSTTSVAGSGMLHGTNTFDEWSRLQNPAMRSPITDALRERVRGPRPEMIPMPEPIMQEPDITLIQGQLLLKLLDIESTRCNAKSDEDDRTDSLANVLEGADHIVERIQSGMAKYMALLGIEENSPPALSIAEMQERSVFNEMNGTTTTHRTVAMTAYQVEMWHSMIRAFDQAGMNIRRAELMGADLNRGGRLSLEDQMTLTFRVRR